MVGKIYYNKLRYPQHQQRAWRQLEQGIHHIDLVVEVRDARIPLTCIKTFEGIRRDRLVVYNKCDLANPQLQSVLTKALKEHRDESIIFTKADTGHNIKKILEYAVGKTNLVNVRQMSLRPHSISIPFRCSSWCSKCWEIHIN